MNSDEIRSKIEELSKEFNTKGGRNRIKNLVDDIKSDLREDDDNTIDRVTNHQRGKLDVPVDNDIGQSISIGNDKIENLSQHITEKIDKLDDLCGDVNSLNFEDLSRSVHKLEEELYGIKDHLEVSLSDHPSGQYYFERDARNINRSQNVDEDKIDELQEQLDNIIEEFQNTSKKLLNLEVPNDEVVKDEIRESRREIMKREMEEMRPYESIGQLKRKFNSGEVFTAQDLADKVDFWSKPTAESTIQEAMEIEGKGDLAEITEVSEGQYKIVY